MPPGLNDILQTYLAQSQTTQTLILIGFALFVVWEFFRFLFGRDKTRDNTLNTVATQLSLVISQQNATANNRDDEYRALFKEIADRNHKADDRWQLLLQQNTSAQTNHTTAVKAMDERTGHLLTAVQRLDGNINATTLNLEALQRLGDEIKADVNRVYDRLALLFPREEPVGTMVAHIIMDAVRDACNEKAATDEHPALNPAQIAPVAEATATPERAL